VGSSWVQLEQCAKCETWHEIRVPTKASPIQDRRDQTLHCRACGARLTTVRVPEFTKAEWWAVSGAWVHLRHRAPQRIRGAARRLVDAVGITAALVPLFGALIALGVWVARDARLEFVRGAGWAFAGDALGMLLLTALLFSGRPLPAGLAGFLGGVYVLLGLALVVLAIPVVTYLVR
jgi:hypothetical protein